MRLLRLVQQIYHVSKFHTYRKCSSLNKESSQLITEMKEFDIPMPYGKLTAKAWGQETGIPVLALHGNQGDCCNFDKLIPLLTNKLYIIAIDSPGQGLSSHRPHGSLYSTMHDLLDYRRAVNFLGWEKFHILGHSYGCGCGLLFSSIFPHLVEKIVAVDTVKPFSFPVSDFPQTMIDGINRKLKFEKEWLKPPKVHAYEYVHSLFLNGRDKMSSETIDVLMKRKTRSSDCGSGVVINPDRRTRSLTTFNAMSHKLLYRFLSGVKCELMLIWGRNSHPLLHTDYPDDVEEVFDIYRKNTKKFVLEYVDGNHYTILENPERLAPIINGFLETK